MVRNRLAMVRSKVARERAMQSSACLRRKLMSVACMVQPRLKRVRYS